MESIFHLKPTSLAVTRRIWEEDLHSGGCHSLYNVGVLEPGDSVGVLEDKQ